jgi:hypothetical protein
MATPRNVGFVLEAGCRAGHHVDRGRRIAFSLDGFLGLRHGRWGRIASGFLDRYGGNGSRVADIWPDEPFAILRARVFDGRVSLHRVQMTNGRFDSSRGAGAGLIDDLGLLCPPDRVRHSRSLDDLERVIGAIGDPLQVGLQIL